MKAGLGADLLLRLTPREAAVDSDYCNTKCPKFSGEDLVAGSFHRDGRDFRSEFSVF